MITIQNICGGSRRRIRSVAVLARVAATSTPFGGWDVVAGDHVGDLSLADVHAVLFWARSVACTGNGSSPQSTQEWECVARDAIARDAIT